MRWRRWLQFCGSETIGCSIQCYFFFEISVLNQHSRERDIFRDSSVIACMIQYQVDYCSMGWKIFRRILRVSVFDIVVAFFCLWFFVFFFFCFVRVPQKMYLSVSFVVVVAEVEVKAYAIEISSIVEAKLPRYWRVSRIWFMYMRKSRRAAPAARLLMQFCTFLCQTATWDFSRSDSFSWNLSRDVSAANSIAVLSCLAYAMVVLWREIGKVTLCALDVQKF